MGDKSVPNAGFTPGRIFPQVMHAGTSLIDMQLLSSTCVGIYGRQAWIEGAGVRHQMQGLPQLHSWHGVCVQHHMQTGLIAMAALHTVRIICAPVFEITSLQEGPGSSSAGATAAETSLAGMSLSEDTQPQASNGHLEPAAGAASVPATAEETDTAAEADVSSAGTSSAPAGHPQTQDELIEVFARLLRGLTCTCC